MLINEVKASGSKMLSDQHVNAGIMRPYCRSLEEPLRVFGVQFPDKSTKRVKMVGRVELQLRQGKIILRLGEQLALQYCDISESMKMCNQWFRMKPFSQWRNFMFFLSQQMLDLTSPSSRFRNIIFLMGLVSTVHIDSSRSSTHYSILKFQVEIICILHLYKFQSL